MIRRLKITIMVAGMLVALGIPAAQAIPASPLTIPSGTEVVPHITYDSNPSASLIKLYDPATGKDVTISSTVGSDSYLWQPQLSEDGERAFFLDYHDYSTDPLDEGTYNERQESIGFVPSNGGKRTRIVTGVGIGGYDLSRDGSKILYQALSNDVSVDDPNPTVHLFTAPVEGNASPTEVPVPSDSPQVSDPIFNQEGTGIFFDGGGQLYYMNLDGTGLKQLTEFSEVYDPETTYTTHPAGSLGGGKELSPDGTSIVYQGYVEGTDYRSGIYELPVSGGTPREVEAPLPGERDPFLHSPHYNHDGSKIMFSEIPPSTSDDPEAGTPPPNVYSVSAADGGDKQLLAEGLYGPGNWEIVNYDPCTGPPQNPGQAQCRPGIDRPGR